MVEALFLYSQALGKYLGKQAAGVKVIRYLQNSRTTEGLAQSGPLSK